MMTTKKQNIREKEAAANKKMRAISDSMKSPAEKKIMKDAKAAAAKNAKSISMGKKTK